MSDRANQDEKAQIPTNMRLLRLFEEVSKAGVPLAPMALADLLKLPKSTVHRLLITAESEGFLQRDIDGQSFGPGKRLRHLAGNTLSSQRIRTERLIIMTALAESVGETCNLAAPGRQGMVYLDRVETHWPLRFQLPIGSQVPFHCTASGKLYLSSLKTDRVARLLSNFTLEALTKQTITKPDDLKRELKAIRARGYATDNEEFMDGMAALAVPIRDRANRLLTTLSIHAPVQRQDLASLVETLDELKSAAAKLELLCND